MPNLFPYLVHNLWLFFTSQITLRRSVTGHTKAGSNTRINYIINQRTRSDLEISRSNSALTSSNSRFRPKTHGLCVPNLVPKKENFGTFLSSFWQLASSSLIPWPYCFYLSYAYLLNKIRFNNYNGSSAPSTFYVVHLIHVFFFRYEKGLLNFVRDRINLVYRINNIRLALQTTKTTIYRPHTPE